MLASFELHCISSIHHLSTDAFVLSLIDNCNYLLSGCPQCLLNHKKFPQKMLLALSRQFPKLTISVFILLLSASCPLIHEYSTNSSVLQLPQLGSRIAQWLEHQTRDRKVLGSNPAGRSSGRVIFSRVNFLCCLLFRYPFHPHVTTVACKRSQSFCQKCRWQVTAKHTYALPMWL